MAWVETVYLPREPRWTPYQAVNYALGEIDAEDKNYANYCDHFMAWVYGYGASGYESAISHWRAIPDKYKHHNVDVPRGAFVFWDIGRFGHIALSVGAGKVASNDVVTWGDIDVVSINYISVHWGARLLGWTPPYLLASTGINPHDPGSPWPMPEVDLSNVRAAAAGPNHTSAPIGTLYIQKSLKREGLLDSYTSGRYGDFTREAYRDWQQQLGFTGEDADGVPGVVSLTRLGDKYGFKVVP